LSGESSQAEAARRHGISETSIGKWKEQFLSGGKDALSTPTGRAGQRAARRGCSARSIAGPVTATQTTRDAINAVEDARCQVHDLLGRSLLDDLTCSHTGQITPVILVSDNGPCSKAGGFARYIASRPELTHVRTRRKSPQTNGVIERYHGAIQIEHLWRDLPADGADMTAKVEAFRIIYNTIRPHETLAGARPIEVFLADPSDKPSDTLSTPVPTRKMRGFLDAGHLGGDYATTGALVARSRAWACSGVGAVSLVKVACVPGRRIVLRVWVSSSAIRLR
jgi:hypothetical protein